MYSYTMSRSSILLAAMLVIGLPETGMAIDYAKLYAEISPSVVTVKTQKIDLVDSRIKVSPGLGTGILIEPDLVLTAAHVVSEVDAVRVSFDDDTQIRAEVVASFDRSDIALLRLDEPRPDPVLATLGDSDAAIIGSPVFIIGAPYGFEQTLSVGYLSGRMNRGELPDGSPIEYLQTDTAINPGNSGGPMFNQEGEVIGVVSFILTKSGGFDGIGFASAINTAYQAMMNSSGYLAGFEGLELTALQSRALSVPENGIIVQRVVADSIAEKLGLKAGTISARIGDQKLLLGGDVILGIKCGTCTSEDGLIKINSIAQSLNVAQPLTLTVFRDGKTLSLVNEQEQITAEYPTELSSLFPQ